MRDDQDIDTVSTASVTEDASEQLAQADIDALFGGSFAVEEPRSGLRALVSSAPVSHERLPMLDVVFDRLVRTLTTSLRNFTGDNIEIGIESVTPVRFSDYMGNIALPALIGVFKASPWDNFGHITVDASLIYSVVDVLLGGRRSTLNTRMNGRAFTTIEIGLIGQMLDIILEDLGASFEPLTPVHFSLDKVETNPKFAVVAQPTNVVAVATVRVLMEDRAGCFQVMIPYATLEPIRDLLLQRFMGEKFGRDNIWETHLAAELYRTSLPLAAVLDEQQLSLGEVMNFEVGQVLPLRIGKGDPIEIRSGDVALSRAHIGQKGNKIAVVVSSVCRGSSNR